MHDLYLGVPCLLGAGGVEKVFEVELTDAERAMLSRSTLACSESIEDARRLLAPEAVAV